MIPRIFRSASRWIFLAALVYAPWAYGATTSATIQITNWLLFAVFVLWVLELLLSRRMPRIPRLLLFLTAALICIGGWMVFNAKSIYDSDFFVFVPLQSFVSSLPGSVDYATSGAWLVRSVLLLGAILFIADMSQSDRWLIRLWYVIGLAGGSIALLGLLQKATGAQMIFWQPPPPPELWVTTFFATYYYHGNAGAFLNLIWPLSAGLVIRSFSNRSHPAMRAAWTTVFLLTIAGALANTSRMAQLIAVLLLVAICIQFGPGLLRKLSGAAKSVTLAGALAIFLALVALASATHLEQPLSRWHAISQQMPGDARWQAARVALGIVPRAGMFGFGPGTFRVVFPAYNVQSVAPAPGTWRFLHDDYLQSMLEWGWAGTALWALVFFGAMAVAIRSYNNRGRSEWMPRRRVLGPLIVIALLGVALHALVDFPFQIESIELYIATYVGLCWGSALWSHYPERRDRTTARQRDSVAS